MAAQHIADEVDIRRRIEDLAGAVGAGDLPGVRAVFAPDVVSFDIEPPLQVVGVDAKMANWENIFETFPLPLTYEIRDLAVTVSGDLAVAHSFNRLLITQPDGSQRGSWVRWTVCFQRIDGDWLITHDHVSAPVDMPSGRSLMNLEP